MHFYWYGWNWPSSFVGEDFFFKSLMYVIFILLIFWESKQNHIQLINKPFEIDPVVLMKKIKIQKFVWCGFFWSFFPFGNFLLIWKRQHCQWRAANFDLCSALMAIEQWGFFNVPHLLWHVYNGHLRGPVTLTPIAERLATPGNGAVTNCSVAAGIRTPNLPLAGRTLKPTAPPMQLNS